MRRGEAWRVSVGNSLRCQRCRCALRATCLLAALSWLGWDCVVRLLPSAVLPPSFLPHLLVCLASYCIPTVATLDLFVRCPLDSGLYAVISASTTRRPVWHLCVLNDKKCDSPTCPFGDQNCHKKIKKKTNYKNNNSSELMYDNVVCIVFKVKCRHTRRMRNAQGVSTNKSRHLRQLFINKCMHAHLWSHILLV